LPVGSVHGAGGADHENQDGRNLNQHHHVVGGGTLANALHQNPGEDHQDQQGGDVEPAPAELAADDWRTSKLGRNMPAEDAVQHVVQVGGEAHGHRHVADGVLQDEIPADDPGHQFAEGGIGVSVRAAGDGDHGGQLGV